MPPAVVEEQGRVGGVGVVGVVGGVDSSHGNDWMRRRRVPPIALAVLVALATSNASICLVVPQAVLPVAPAVLRVVLLVLNY